MILCRECGNSAPSNDGFCSSCGALLDWSGERVETKILPAVPGAAPGPSTGASADGRAADPGAWTAPATPANARRPDPAATRPALGTSSNPGPGGTAPSNAVPSNTVRSNTVRSNTAPSNTVRSNTAPSNTAPSNTARSETAAPHGWIPAAEARRADPVPVPAQPEYTGPFCQACGVRNPEGRRFCRSCGAMLQLPALPAPARGGWWRRLVDRITGRRREFSAGQRPSGFRDHQNSSPLAPRRRGLRLPRHIKLGRLAPILIVAGLAGIGLGPARTWVTTEANTLLGKAKARVNQHYVNVTPVGASAVCAKDHGAALAIDGLNTTYWASSQHPDGVGETLTISFAAPVDIDQVGILSGADPQDFRAFARPHDLVVTAAGASPVSLSFDDSADFQSRAATLRHVTSVTITVKDAYPGQSRHDLAVRDLEFFVKSG